MKRIIYLLDTHALLFWVHKKNVSTDFINHLDAADSNSNLKVSSISFWEIALLQKKDKIDFVNDLESWKNKLLIKSNIQIISPTVEEMILSSQLPDLHKDPFDRLLIAQAQCHDLTFVTKDRYIPQYNVKIFWI